MDVGLDLVDLVKRVYKADKSRTLCFGDLPESLLHEAQPEVLQSEGLFRRGLARQ